MAKADWMKITGCVLMVIALILMIVSFAGFFSANSRMGAAKDNVSDMYDTWKSDLVFDITNTDSKTLAANEYLAPWQGYWPGSIEGCYCSSSS